MFFAAAIETPRLYLRPWRATDLEGFHGIWGDPAVIWWRNDHSLALSGAGLALVIASTSSSPVGVGCLAAIERASGAVVGEVIVQPAPFAPGDFELGYHFAVAGQRRGLATEASRALLDHVFAVTDLPRVVAAIVPANQPSLRVAARLGFRRWGEAMHAGLSHLTFELARDDFRAHAMVP